MRFGISADFLHRPGNGWQTYTAELLPAMLAIDHRNEYHLYVSRKLDQEQFPFLSRPNVITHVVVPDAAWIRLPLCLPLMARRHALDLLHVQHAGPPLCPCPLVATVHDLSFERRPDLFTRSFRLKLAAATRTAVDTADRIISVSEATRRDLVEIYHVPQEKISTIHSACGRMFRPVPDAVAIDRIRSLYRTSARYVLFVGELHPRKNVRCLIESFHLFRRRYGAPHKLVIAGAHWNARGLVEAAQQQDLQGVIEFSGFVRPEDLPALYSGADLFAFLSEFEGFGLAVLEAMSCGLPVLISRDPALREVAGPAGVSVDPNDTEAVAAAMNRVLTEPGLRKHLADRALARAAEFSWQTCARRTLEVYRQVCEGVRGGAASGRRN